MLPRVGLVVDHTAGTRRLHGASPDGIAALQSELDRFWDQVLTAFRAIVESPTGGT